MLNVELNVLVPVLAITTALQERAQSGRACNIFNFAVLGFL
jgi:hypothetical protein